MSLSKVAIAARWVHYKLVHSIPETAAAYYTERRKEKKNLKGGLISKKRTGKMGGPTPPWSSSNSSSFCHRFQLRLAGLVNFFIGKDKLHCIFKEPKRQLWKFEKPSQRQNSPDTTKYFEISNVSDLPAQRLGVKFQKNGSLNSIFSSDNQPITTKLMTIEFSNNLPVFFSKLIQCFALPSFKKVNANRLASLESSSYNPNGSKQCISQLYPICCCFQFSSEVVQK